MIERAPWTPKTYAYHLLAGHRQAWAWPCLQALWQRESRWDPHAVNRVSGAGGIPQALPASKMGAHWWGNFKAQIRWGWRYIRGRYRTPCGAWAHSEIYGWY